MRQFMQIILKFLYILTVIIIIFNKGLSAQNSNFQKIRDARMIEELQNEVDTLKFRINELTREVALMKAAIMKLPADVVRRPSASNKRENFEMPETEQPRKNPKLVIDNKSLKKSTTTNIEKKTEPQAAAASAAMQLTDFNIIYQSRSEINQLLRYSLILPNTNISNLKLSIVFNNYMKLSDSSLSNNLELISDKKTSKEFLFRILQGSNILKFAFIAGITGTLNAEIILFNDSNNNSKFDEGEQNITKTLTQLIVLD